jgi:hypothetical protein
MRRAGNGPAALPGDRVLRYDERFTVVLWGIGALGLLEIGVVHVLTAAWPAVRWSLFALGVLGLVGSGWWMLGLRRRPHLVREGALVLRSGRAHEVVVPLADLSRARREVLSEHRKLVAVDDDRLVVSVMGDTNVELWLDPPAEVVVRGRPAAVSRLQFYADDPSGAVRAIRESAGAAPR